MTNVDLLIPVSKVSLEDMEVLHHQVPEFITTTTLVFNDKKSFDFDEKNFKDISIVKLNNPIGKAEAIRIGLDKILQSNKKCDLIVQSDIRGKQPLRDTINILFNEIIEKECDAVISDRYALQSIEKQPHRTAVVSFFKELMSNEFGINVNDCLCGTRIYNRNAANIFLNSTSFGYGIEIEQLMLLSESKMVVESVPVASNKQNNYTESEKIEDVFYSLLSHSNSFKNKNSSLILSECLYNIKTRCDFFVRLNNGVKRYYFKRSILNDNASYTNQKPSDVYNITIV